MRRHPIVCPMAAAGKCEAQWKYGGHHFFTYNALSLYFTFLLIISSFIIIVFIYNPLSLYLLLPASRTDRLFMRCAASGRPWPKQRLHPPVDLVVGRRARCRVLKLLSGEPDSSSRLGPGVPRPSPRSGILSSKAMDRSDKSGDAAWVAWVGHGLGMGEL
jgi:hypothetical protein